MLSQGKVSRPSKNESRPACRLQWSRRVLKMAGGALALSLLPPIANANKAFSATDERKSMKIVIITGSPHKNGTSALLTEEFIAGATSKGHTIVCFDAAFEKVSPCKGCYFCHRHNGVCVQKDAMEKILPEVLSADMIVLVTPIYYYGMSAQIKTVLDRFQARGDELKNHPMKSALLATCGGDAEWSMDGLLAHYQCLCRYLPWEEKGKVLAKGVPGRKDIEGTKFPAEARAFGLSL
jgi:NAD(P)H-dependent FMN reductase